MESTKSDKYIAIWLKIIQSQVSLEMRAKSYGALMTAMQKSSKWQKGCRA